MLSACACRITHVARKHAACWTAWLNQRHYSWQWGSILQAVAQVDAALQSACRLALRQHVRLSLLFFFAPAWLQRALLTCAWHDSLHMIEPASVPRPIGIKCHAGLQAPMASSFNQPACRLCNSSSTASASTGRTSQSQQQSSWNASLLQLILWSSHARAMHSYLLTPPVVRHHKQAVQVVALCVHLQALLTLRYGRNTLNHVACLVYCAARWNGVPSMKHTLNLCADFELRPMLQQSRPVHQHLGTLATGLAGLLEEASHLFVAAPGRLA